MDGFTYHNIFQTKGIEYLVIIAFLLLLIPFWAMINRRKQIAVQLRKAVGFTLDLLKIPLGVLYSRNHTWTFMEKSGTAEVGVDNFLLQLTGSVKVNCLKNTGEEIRKGDLITEIEHNGKILRIHSPISGKILALNASLYEDPASLVEETYTKGWIYKIEPSDWVAETGPYLTGEAARGWFGHELLRFKDFVVGSLAKIHGEGAWIVLQEGGELYDQPLADLPPEVWQDFQREFLDKA